MQNSCFQGLETDMYLETDILDGVTAQVSTQRYCFPVLEIDNAPAADLQSDSAVLGVCCWHRIAPS